MFRLGGTEIQDSIFKILECIKVVKYAVKIMLECALYWFLPFVVLHIQTSQVVPAMKHSRFYSENKLVKQDTNCQLSLKICLFQQQAFKCEALN